MLVVKTGMQSEADVASSVVAPGTFVLAGQHTPEQLQALIPTNCDAIMSFGLCGGLAPQAEIAQVFLCTTLVTPDGSFEADKDWIVRLFARTKLYAQHWYSTGVYNEANTPEQRAAIFNQTGAWVIDDESYSVAIFAKQRGIPFTIMRSVSDGYADTVPPAADNAINPDGSFNLWSLLTSLASDPGQIAGLIKMASQYNQSLGTLKQAALELGPTFLWTS